MSAVAAIMTGKYKRKPVPSHLEIRGFSRNGTGIDSFNTTDNSQSIIPQEFNEVVQEAISQYDPESNHSSPINTSYLVAENPHWTNLTGNTTDRSSSYSTATYDDFDREASANVERLFDEIDSQLYTERRDSTPINITPQLYDECKDWSGAFPHLRILGSPFIELKNTGDRGFHLLESPDSAHYTNSQHSDDLRSRRDSNNDYDNSSIMVEGSRLKAKCLSDSQSHTDHYKQLEEEVIVQDGYYEDIIAIDNDTHEDVLDSLSFAAVRRKKSSRYPPVTPNACAKHDVFNAVFDIIWTQVNKVMRVLLQRYSEHFVLNHPMSIPAAEGNEQEHIKLPQIMPITRFEHGVLPINQPHLRHLTGSVQSRPSPFAVASPNNQPLKELLQISKMGMTERKTFIEESGTETPLGVLSSTQFKKGLAPRNQSANTRKIPIRRQLAPLNDPHKDPRVRTPSVDDEILRGTSITKSKRLNSPTAMGNRTLPPINAQTHDLFLDHPQDALVRTSKKVNRASSAINEKIIINETRPSTTHTIYPTAEGGLSQYGNLGLINNRSTTPLDRPKLRPDGNRGVLTNLGITGSSLITGSSHLIDEEAEKYHESLATGPNNHQNWAPPHTPGAQYRRNKLNSSFVR